MNCRKVIRQLPAYLDHELSEADAKELQGHLEVCVFCSTELASLQAASKMLDTWQNVPPRRCYVHAVINQIRVEEQGALHRSRIWSLVWKPRWAAGALRAAATIILLVGALLFSGDFQVERVAEKVALDNPGHLQPAKELIPLAEDMRRSYITPSEYGLVLRDMQNRGHLVRASSWNAPVRNSTENGFFPGKARFPAVDHIYFPGEGMPVESVIPVDWQ